MPGSQPPVSALITCEHASRAVPEPWQALFAGHEGELESHRGWDPGTGELGRALSRRLHAPLLVGQATRLLVDLNRSAGHPQRFSAFTRHLARSERARIEREWWLPHWQAYRGFLEQLPGRVVHLACHSFTPVMDGRERRVDIGLLYDPSRKCEKRFCEGLRREIEARRPELRVRMNAPYRGTSNGLGQQHRSLFPATRLISVELEVNQRLVGDPDWPGTAACLVAAVEGAMQAEAGASAPT